MLGQLINKPNRPRGRFFLKGFFFSYFLILCTDNISFISYAAKEEKGVFSALGNNTKSPRTAAKPKSYRQVSKTEPGKSNRMAARYPSIYAENLLIKSEVRNLLESRKVIYEERRTLTPSEISDLHSVKNNERFPFAVRNEAQLFLRELAIEHRIPQECTEDVSSDCLIILERSHAGSMPFECQNPHNTEGCIKAFAEFWES